MKNLLLVIALITSVNSFAYEDIDFVNQYPTLQTALDNIQDTYNTKCELSTKGFPICFGGTTLGGDTSMGNAFVGVCTRVRKYNCGKNIKVKSRFSETSGFDSETGHYITRKLKSVKVKIKG